MHKIQTRLIIFTIDILALILAVMISGIASRYISHQFFGHPYFEMCSNMALGRFANFAILSALALFIFYSQNQYSRRIPWWNQVEYIISTLAFMLLIEVFIHFAVKNQISRLWIFSSWSLAFLFIIIGRQISRIIGDFFKIWSVKTIIIGDKNNIIEITFALCSENYAGYQITKIIINDDYENFDIKELPLKYHDVEIIGQIEDYDQIISKNNDCFYIIALDSFGNFDIADLVKKITVQNLDYAIVPPVEGIKLYGTKPQYFFGYDVMFLQSRENINSPMAKLLKRIMDIIGSLCGIIILSPLLIIIAFLIKKDSGPAFFFQERIGKKGKYFKCWKFRTMKINAENLLQDILKNDPKANELWKTHRKIINDPRITKIGKFLRSSSLDELPQLFNVLKGDMSLVGPRPMIPDEVIFFDDQELACYKSVRPGISGLWQVSGRNEVSFKQRVYFDNWYVRNWSIWHDIVIIIKTVFVVIKRVGAR